MSSVCCDPVSMLSYLIPSLYLFRAHILSILCCISLCICIWCNSNSILHHFFFAVSQLPLISFCIHYICFIFLCLLCVCIVPFPLCCVFIFGYDLLYVFIIAFLCCFCFSLSLFFHLCSFVIIHSSPLCSFISLLWLIVFCLFMLCFSVCLVR